MKKQKNNTITELSVADHLKELKSRIVVSVIYFIIFFIINLYYSNNLMNFILKIGNNANYQFIYLAPQEILIQQIKLAGTFALLCSIPIILYECIQFIAPVFIEKKHAVIHMIMLEIIGLIMFFIGLVFAYKILLPFTFSYLHDIGNSTNIQAQISIEKYISLFITIMICIGSIFEIPLISIMLTKIGLISSSLMKKGQNIAIVIIFIIAAIVTPPDVVSQCIVAIPMIILYKISILLCKMIEKRKENS